MVDWLRDFWTWRVRYWLALRLLRAGMLVFPDGRSKREILGALWGWEERVERMDEGGRRRLNG